MHLTRAGEACRRMAQACSHRVDFTWDPPIDAVPGVLYQLLEHTSSTPSSSAVQIVPDTPQTSIVVPKTDTTTRFYWVRAKDPRTGSTSAVSPPLAGVPGNAATASTALAAVVAPGSANVSDFASSLTTPTVTVAASGGTPGYIYATSFISGGTGITINNGTTTTPSFSATGLAEGDVKSGTARIRVTDSVAATFDVNVTVVITRLYGVTLNNTTINASGSLGGPGGGGGPAIATYAVAPDGNVYPAPFVTQYQWKNPSASASDYDVRFSLTSGAIDTSASSATATWLQLNTGRSWLASRLPAEGAGTSITTATIEIRLHASPFTVLATATLTMNRTIT